MAIFETEADGNPSGGAELLPATPRHWGGVMIARPDGGIRWVDRKHGPPGLDGAPTWLKEYEREHF